MPRSTQASGSTASAIAPSAASALTHPSAPVRNSASGTTANWPNDPPAFTSPLARPRACAGTARPTADISTPSPAMPAPPAAMTPITTSSSHAVCAYGVSAVPIATSTAPVAMTRPEP